MEEKWKIKGILFDFNGTILFDSALQEDVWKKFLRNKIGREITNEEIYKYIHGGNNKTVLSYFFNRVLSDGEVEELGEEKESMYRDMCLKDKKMFKLVKGLPEFLDKLKEARIPITIATGAPISNVKFYFEHLNLGKWFDINKVVYTDGSFKGKPEPDIFLKAAKNINVDIENCAVFEDAILGIEAAKRANAAKIIAVSSTLENNKLLSIDGISYVIKDFTEISIDNL